MSFAAQVPQITEEGRKQLGKILKAYRLSNNWSIEQLLDIIEQRTGYKFSKSTISAWERGNSEPTYNNMSILAHAGYLPFTTDQLFTIACGLWKPELPSVWQNN